MSILIFLLIFILRVTTLLTSGSEMDNRVLATAGYLYSFNTLCLTLRVFGYITEQSRHLGVIQIALFNILKDISTIILQFLAGILAFSIAITKVYMAEKSFIANGNARNDITCKSSGISCWWAMVTHLGWSLLGESDKSDPMMSVDFPSDTIAQILYAAFLVFAVVLLLNMLIALLCNTYQRIEDNSLKVWLMKRAVTIQTYDAYDPVPVPLNIVYSIGKLLIWLVWKVIGKKVQKKKERIVLQCCQYLIMKELEKDYFEKCGEFSFPATDEDKIERVLYKQNEDRKHLEQSIEENRKCLEQSFQKNRQQMLHYFLAGQALSTTFTSQGGDHAMLCSVSKMWKHHRGIRIEGHLLTCEDVEEHVRCGAQYLKPFSAEVPHFEVFILETGEQRVLGIGVAHEDYKMHRMPGCAKGTVGYRTDNGNIFHASVLGKESEGPVIASQGDQIRCTVMFENEKVSGDKKKVPAMFFLNGRKIVTEEGKDHFFLDSDKPLYPCVGMTDGCIVLAKMCPREFEDPKSKNIQSLEKTEQKFNTSLEELVKEVEKHKKETNQKLDALLASLADIKKDLQNTKTSD